MRKLAIQEKKKKGFTLIELIIVIAIIAVLAAIAIPKFGTVKHDGDVAADKANGKNISLAIAKGIAEDKIKETAGTYTLDKLPGASADVNIKTLIDGINETTKSKVKNDIYKATITATGDITVTTSGVEVYPDAGNDYN